MTAGRVAAGLVATVLACTGQAVEGQSFAVTELKAEIVSRFAPYIQWPAAALPLDAPLLICVVNDQGVADALRRTIADRSVGGHKLAVTSLAADAPLPSCQMLYVTGPDAMRSVATVAAAPVFTMGDANDFVSTGGMVKLFRRNGRLCFEVNLEPIHRAGMKLSARVLVLADVVRDARGVVMASERD
ncbi:MAG: YfiR family protein [Vicinamibacterales bacterium]